NGLEAAGRHQPRPRISRYAVARPLRQRGGKGIVQRFFSQLEIAEQSDQCREHPARFLSVHDFDARARLSSCVRNFIRGHETVVISGCREVKFVRCGRRAGNGARKSPARYTAVPHRQKPQQRNNVPTMEASVNNNEAYVPQSQLKIISILTLVYTFNYMDRVVFASVGEVIKHDLILSDLQLGVLGGLAFAAFYAGFGLPLARLAERFNRLAIISVCVTVWS